ncbi:similar to surface-anchored extracellular endonuclease 1 [Alteracholeplasma palmae J233]|uniref:Similar to surface-anchored extracellular endonuclease 1 n=1 Tax=Alteracholeplasma palmae (strain ATCC 49389 / J233) TaxID=1318466 RepID=U4KQV8_ALTPJ|nr:immunoglobulin-like domain-containing protein [Alteracholeplasma palmae]CCV63641.1 similar to surface-anchored extracellular endonuclease 1 [Alteracholeplasma palmae J233]
MKKIVTTVVLFALSLVLVACGKGSSALTDAKEALQIQYQAGDQYDSVTRDITLPTSLGSYEGLTIEWASDNQSLVIEGTKGKVVQGSENITVNLTATLKLDGKEETKPFSIVVIKKEVVELALSIKSKYVGEPYGESLSDGLIDEHLQMSAESNLTVSFFAENSKTKTIFNNKFQETRLYPGSKNGSKLVITALNGKKITKVEVVFGPQNGGLSVNGLEANKTISEKISVDIDSLESVTLQNVADATSGNRIDIKEIIVTIK